MNDRARVNWFEAVYQEDYLSDRERKPERRRITDTTPAAYNGNRPGKKNKPKTSICHR